MVQALAETSVDIPALQRSKGEGRLAVKFALGATRTKELYQQGCARIRIPGARHDGLEAVMINTSGGMTGGDRLDWQFRLEDETTLSVTSQACERVYAATQGTATVNVNIHLGSAARLAWLPQETILFNRGSFARRIVVEMAKDSELFMVEPVVFGRQAMHEKVLLGDLRDCWRISRIGELLHAEEARFTGAVDQLLKSRAVAHGGVAMATVLLVAPRAGGLLAEARQILGEAGDASFWCNKLLARLIAPDSYALRQKLIPLINLLNNGTALPKTWMI